MKMNVIMRRMFLLISTILILHNGNRIEALEGELSQIKQQLEQQTATEAIQTEMLEEIITKQLEPQQKSEPQAQPQAQTTSVKSTHKSLGVFTATAYCKENYPHICNNGNALSTATGTTPTAGRTIAVDPKVIPLGSKVIINGHTYIAEDTGGAIKGKRIDIVFDTHSEALKFGRQQVEVFVEG